MNRKKCCLSVLTLFMLIFSISAAGVELTLSERWPAEKAQQWYHAQPWLIGCNFIPSNAVNQLEMWQEDTFDPETIERELGWAEKLGFNVVRVYLHDLAYEQDPKGFLKRMDRFLEIADKHDIRALFVIFDDCWLADPKAGKQPEPLPGVHNSGWLESPGLENLKRYPTDAKLRKRLEKYATAVISCFKNDKRVLMWDLYNEPGGWWYRCGDENRKFSRGLTGELCVPLLQDVYIWARKVNPSQPITSCWNRGDYEVYPAFNWADVTTFHHYGNTDSLENLIAKLKKGSPNRPVICTEYLWRAGGDTFQATLPVLQKHDIGAINWGLVAGKTNTMWGWSSWADPDPTEPKVWHHDILRPDGTAYDQNEVDLIKSLTKAKSRLAINLEAGKQQTVVTYGTSLTASGAWVRQLQQTLDTSYPGRSRVINSGAGSMWSKWGVDNLDKRVIEKKPDTVLIEFGINDAFLPYKTSVEQARKNLENMIGRILKSNPGCEIILMVMNLPIAVHLEQRPKIKDYYQMYRQVSHDRNLLLIDHYPNWQKVLNEDIALFNSYVPDGIHPGPEGCRKIIIPEIIKSLGITNKLK